MAAATAAAPAVVAAAPTVAPAPTLSSERVHFEPIPVFVGPKPGWTGPVLAARAAPSDVPSDASAYTGEMPAAAETPPDAATAPVALQGAVKIPPPTKLRPLGAARSHAASLSEVAARRRYVAVLHHAQTKRHKAE